MIVFTILGYFCFLCFMGQIGWHLALWLDLRRGLVKMTAPVFNELDGLMAMLAVFDAKAIQARKATP